jgi:hypothetical protein
LRVGGAAIYRSSAAFTSLKARRPATLLTLVLRQALR